MALFARKRPQQQSLVAAGSRVPLDDRVAAKRTLERRQKWQGEGWEVFDTVGEVKDLGTRIGNAMRRVRLYAAERPDDDPDGEPVPSTNPEAVDAVDRLRSVDGSHGELMSALAINFTVAGECYLIGRPDEDEDEDWAIHSTEEIEIDGRQRLGIKDPDTGKVETLPANAFVGRMWLRHAAFRVKADSPLHGVLSVCDQLKVLDRALWVARRNRAILRGILGIPSEATLGPIDPTKEGDERGDPFMAKLEEHLTAAMDPESMASASPLLLRVNGDNLDKINLLEFDDKIEGILEEQQALIKRLGSGMNAPPEYITGLGQATHWNAWQITEERYTDYFEPLVHAMCGALTSTYLYPSLDPERRRNLLIWADPSALIVRPDRSKDADEAFDRGAINYRAYRSAKGFEEEDAPTPDELQTIIALRGPKPVPYPTEEQGPPPQPEGRPEEEDAPAEEAIAAAAAVAEAGVTAALQPGGNDTSTNAMVCVMPSPEQQQSIARDGGDPAEILHVTLCFLGETTDWDDEVFDTIRGVCERAAAASAPIEGIVAGVGHFDVPDLVPCFGLVDALGLSGLRSIVANGLNAAGIEYAQDHDFVPHMTLGYHEPDGHDPSADEVTGEAVSFGELIFRVGDDEQRWPLTGEALTAATKKPKAPEARDVGPELSAIDMQLKIRLHAAADAVLERALEKAGARIRSKAQRDSSTTRAAIKDLEPMMVARRLGPSLVAAMGLDESELVADALESLRGRFDAWVQRAQEDALAIVPDLADVERSALFSRQAEDRAEAWAWMLSALSDVATQRLYSPVPETDGEFDAATLVPFGIVREAVARAGGNALATDGPMGGIATGGVVLDTLRGRGAAVEGYEWVYGSYPRQTFEPHLALNGVTFENFDAEVLGNDFGWPDTTHFYPGDHDGCTCDFRLAVLLPEPPKLAIAAGGSRA